MYAVEFDRSKRLLVISAAQKVTAEEAKMVAQRIGEVLQDVAPGFRVRADFRGLESMHAAAGLAAAPEVFGLNKSPRLNLPGEGDGAGCVAGAGVGMAFFIARCFAGVCDGEGDSAGLGDCACEIQMPANPTTAMRAEIFV